MKDPRSTAPATSDSHGPAHKPCNVQALPMLAPEIGARRQGRRSFRTFYGTPPARSSMWRHGTVNRSPETRGAMTSSNPLHRKRGCALCKYANRDCVATVRSVEFGWAGILSASGTCQWSVESMAAPLAFRIAALVVATCICQHPPMQPGTTSWREEERRSFKRSAGVATPWKPLATARSR